MKYINNFLGDQLDFLVPIDVDNFSLCTIIINQVDRLLKKEIQAALNSFTHIIRPLVEFTPVQITSSWRSRRMGEHVIHMLLLRLADKASRQSLNKFLARNAEINRRSNLLASVS